MSFEIRQYLVNFTGLAGIINETDYKTEPIFTGLGQIVLIFNTVQVSQPSEHTTQL